MQSILQRLLKLLIFYVTLLSLFAGASSQILSKEEFNKLMSDQRKDEQCLRERMDTVIRYPGCDSVKTRVSYCTGSCFSFAVQSITHPYDTDSQTFRCCAAREIHVKRRRLLFRNCSDSENGEPMLKTIFFPNILSCNCTKPSNIRHPIVIQPPA